MSVAYIIANDDSGHNYLIPEHRREHWDAWIGSSDWEDGDVPDYAEAINGPVSKVRIFGWEIA